MATFAGNPAAAFLDGTEVVPITQGGLDKRTTIQAIADLVGAPVADVVAYDNLSSGLTATDVQGAIDEIAEGRATRNVVTALSISSGVVTVDCALGDYFTLTPTAAVTGWSFTNVPTGCTITIKVQQGGTAYAVAMPALKWAVGTAGAFSTTANARDRLAMTTDDGGATWDATLGKAFA